MNYSKTILPNYLGVGQFKKPKKEEEKQRMYLKTTAAGFREDPPERGRCRVRSRT